LGVGKQEIYSMTEKLPVPEEIAHLIKCNCKKGCKTNKRSCKMKNFVCSEMCKGYETCENAASLLQVELDPSCGSDDECKTMKFSI
jgi:hypothetical protein